MKVTVTMQPYPRTKPDFFRTETFECERMERDRPGSGPQKWLTLYRCKDKDGKALYDFNIAEEIIREVKMEEF
jgi:hypothetical protein